MKKIIASCALALAILPPSASCGDLITAAPGAVHISLARGGCRGHCPVYRIDIYADGTLLYEGYQEVDALGKERFVLPPEEVSKLVRTALTKNLMALKDRYEWSGTDLPTNTVRLTIGGRTHQILDNAGQMAGMPAAVAQFEQEIDDVLDRAVKRRLAPGGLAQLAAEGFRFNSPAGLNLLGRAVRASSTSDDKVRLDIFERLDPARMSGEQIVRAGKLQDTMVSTAIAQGRTTLVTQMLSKGALRTGGKYDQTKIDQAFVMAVYSSRPVLVEMLWQLPDNAPHPALKYQRPSPAPGKPARRVPLTLMLGSDPSRPNDENDFKIAKFLIEKGSNSWATLAENRTLLHVATLSNDANFVRYVLGLGVDPSMPDQFGLPALASVQTEQVAMALLEGGMSRASIKRVVGFKKYCRDKGWHRVLAWLKTHDH